MNIWTVANLKGGVGKTTTALTLGGLATAKGLNVVLVDLDPHCSLTSYFLRGSREYKKSSFNFFSDSESQETLNGKQALQDNSLQDIGLQDIGQKNLHLIPASPALASIDRQPMGYDGAGFMVKAALQQIKTTTDLVIIDAPPMAGVLMVNAIMACDQLVIPVQTDYLGVQGLRRMLDTLALLKETGYDQLSQSLIVPTLFDRRTHASIVALESLRDEFGDRVWSNQIGIDTKFKEASALGQLPHKLNEECSGINTYRSLLDDLLQKNQTQEVKVELEKKFDFVNSTNANHSTSNNSGGKE